MVIRHSIPVMNEWTLQQKQNCLVQRARIVQQVRSFFIARGFLEVETPCLMPAPIPEAHIEPLSCGDWVLHPSPELCMKRLLAAGYPRIFQITRCFRFGERGRIHLPEFTILEWYHRDCCYLDLMSDCETLFNHVTIGHSQRSFLTYQGSKISLQAPWERITVRDAFARFAPISLEKALYEGTFDELLVDYIEPQLGLNGPTFLYDYPVESGTLARAKKGDPTAVERFELYIKGIELANGFSELADPAEHRRRFGKIQEERVRCNKTIHPIPEKFLQSLESFPESAGIALGLDRYVMILLDQPSISNAVAFTPDDL